MLPSPFLARGLKPLLVLFALSLAPALPVGAADCVILLHGLARTSASMEPLAGELEAHGYAVANIDYPSRKHSVQELSSLAVESGLAACPLRSTIHFVTHSLGGILIRYYLEQRCIPNLGRVVMLAPPNQGSEVVDAYRNIPGFEILNGPAGFQLGTDAGSIPVQLGPVDYEVGVIAGTGTINPILSQSLANPDDGKVSVENTKVAGMQDFVMVPRSHSFIMQAPEVIAHVLSFLATGYFGHAEQP